MRNVLADLPERGKALVAAAIRTIFAQPERDGGWRKWSRPCAAAALKPDPGECLASASGVTGSSI